MAHAECLGQFVKRDDGRIALTPLKVAEILLAETGACLHVLLSQSFLMSQPSEVASNQFAHVHARTDCRAQPLSLSTIICYSTGSVEMLNDLKDWAIDKVDQTKELGQSVAGEVQSKGIMEWSGTVWLVIAGLALLAFISFLRSVSK